MAGYALKGLVVAAGGTAMGALIRAGRPQSPTFRFLLEDVMRRTGCPEEQRDELSKQLRFWARAPAAALLVVLVGVFVMFASFFMDRVQD